MSAHRQMAIELREATKQRNTWKEKCDRQTEMVMAKQDNLEQCTMLLTGWQKSPLRSFCSPSARRARASRSEAKHACAGGLMRLRAAAIVRAWSAATLLLATHRMLMLMRSMEDTQAEPAWFRGALDPSCSKLPCPLARGCPGCLTSSAWGREERLGVDGCRSRRGRGGALSVLPADQPAPLHTRARTCRPSQPRPSRPRPSPPPPPPRPKRSRWSSGARSSRRSSLLSGRGCTRPRRGINATRLGRHRGLETYGLLAQTPHMQATRSA